MPKKGGLYMNKVHQIGRLTKDPELRYVAAGDNKAVANFKIAVPKRNRGEANFFEVEAWDDTAEFVHKYFKKGTKIALSGSLEDKSYRDNNGVYHVKIVIVANEVEFAESKKSE